MGLTAQVGAGFAQSVDLDEATVALLKAHKRERGGLALKLARDDALVLGDLEGPVEAT
jgi:hypothetical protein